MLAYGDEINLLNESSVVTEISYLLNDNIELLGPDANYLYPSAGIDTIIQIVTDKYGCTDTAYYVIDIIAVDNVYIPNAFTPNGDGRNDLLIPVYGGDAEIKSYKLSVFNRWGEEVFYSDHIAYGWNGTHKGAIVQSGVYSYKIYFNIKGENYQKIGHVSVLY